MKGGFSTIVLAIGVVAFAFACRYALQSGRDAEARAETNRKTCARIASLDTEYSDFLADEVAAGRLLDQALRARDFRPDEWFANAAEEIGAGKPTVAVRTSSEVIAGHPLCEATVVWADVDPEAFQRIVEKAESSEPPIRLRRIDIKARTGGRIAVSAVFSAFSGNAAE